MLLKAEVNKIISGPHKVRKQVYKTVFYVADVYVTVDLEAIALTLGQKAMGNKNKQAKYLGGAVIVKAANIQQEVGT
jgi:hypothetical protein